MKHNYIKTLLVCFTASTVFASSCQKDNGIDNLGGKATVTVDMRGVGPSAGNKANAGLRASASSGKMMATPAVQRQVIKFNDQFNVTATLKEVSTAAAAPAALRASANRAATTTTGVGEIFPLPTGTAYTVVISQGNEVVATETFTQGEGAHKFNIEAGSYTYTAYAYGDESSTGAAKDPLWVSGNFSVTAGDNTLSIVLEHRLTEVTVVFNAGSGRTINSIGAGTLAPNHIYEFNEETGAVTFGGVTTAAAVSFTGQTAGQIWTSNPTMIAVEDTDNGVVELPNVTINDIQGSITSGGWALKAGVQYTLELNLGDKEDTGIEVGGSTWAPGHLAYDPETGSYGFTSNNEISDSYFFPNYVTPKVFGLNGNNDDINRAPTSAQNGAHGDPCALVMPLNTWRLPTTTEMNTLKRRTEPFGTNDQGADNPGPNQYAPARWGGHYKGTSGQEGVFFGTQSQPAENEHQYLFIPYTGVYNNGPDKQEKGFGYYLLRNSSGNFGDLQVQGAYTMNVSETPRSSSTAYQVRCVRAD
ncbi:hypothetical protein FXV77_01095 [Sphingobacterium phlebotomi]|uniref:Fimbrillin-like protein n=1 Tax=Sphingobacterium phlebotomi TaxID=2605433 RepID=A0A5D4HCQ5_9SPHI|nr:hypothetical protein [Sphingobacterium phlebotomi]TYR37913.1 hypothetical protein FXV77_01095 [Sphingobacterium phlebotomi]